MTAKAIDVLKFQLEREENEIAYWEDQLQLSLNDIRASQDHIANSRCVINHYKLAIEALEKRFDLNGES